MNAFRCYRDDTTIAHKHLLDRSFGGCMASVGSVSLQLGSVERGYSTLEFDMSEACLPNSCNSSLQIRLQPIIALA